MAGRKGQRGSGGHNKKTDAEKEMLGTLQACRSTDGGADPAVLDRVLSVVGTDSAGEMRRLYGIYSVSADAWANDPTDKEARLSATAAFDRFLRLVAECTREAPKDDAGTSGQNDDAMAALIAARNGST
ncbi:hypothetical protein [Stieleria sp.]|uniref:hypothetical protein n=1 Tax=Stieleria sp. TaxID=2795976 RepID=UPI003566950F